MRTLVARASIFGAAAVSLATAAFAGGPSFVVWCMQTSGPTSGDKYGTYYFFLKEGHVKGSVCGVPGHPCSITGNDGQTIAFQTPGESPDTMTIDLRSGAIQRTSSSGLRWTYTCRQVQK